MRTKHRISIRFISLFMAVLTLLTSIRMLAFVIPVAAATPVTIRDDAQHFFIRHWHTGEDGDAQYQGGSEEEDKPEEGDEPEEDDGGKDYFVVVEGYIIPRERGNSGAGYDCWFVKQDGTNELVSSNEAEASPYIETFDSATGTVVLKTKPLMDGNDPLEVFAGISISAGYDEDVVSYNSAGITITYSEKVTLVKGHVFYRTMSMIVTGTVDTKAFAGTGLFDDPEVDTAWAYTYTTEDPNGFTDANGTHKQGDLVMRCSDSANPERACTSLDDLPHTDATHTEQISEDNVTLTKFYSTAAGLHTDKTLMQTEDGRLFLYSLESWYIEGLAPQIGLILDASGSMGFAAETPTAINVNDIITALEEAAKKGDTSARSDADALKALLEEKGDAMRDGPQPDYVYPQVDQLIGYYKFDGVPSGETHTLDGSKVTAQTSGVTYYDGNYFTLHWRSGSSADKGGFHFGGGANETGGWVEFTTTNTAVVTLAWQTTNTSDPRGMKMERYDPASGSWVDYQKTELSLNKETPTWPDVPAGTYRIASQGSSVWIYEIKVVEEAANAVEDTTLKNSASAVNDSVNETAAAVLVSQADFNKGDFRFTSLGSNSDLLTVGDNGLDYGVGNYGVLLDAAPSLANGGFTVSFTINSANVESQGNLADLLYIGPDSGTAAGTGYYRGYRNSTNSSNRFAGGNGYKSDSKASSVVTNINSVFDKAAKHVITLVFTEGSVYSYLDGVIALNVSSPASYEPNNGANNGIAFGENIRIVIDGIQDSYSSDKGTLCVDDVFVYDAALDSDEVAQLFDVVNSNRDIKEREPSWNSVFLSSGERDLILNPYNTDTSDLGAAGYNYFVYDAREGTTAYTPLGYYRNDRVPVTPDPNAGAGWYYATYSGTTKSMRGVPAGLTFTDTITPGQFSLKDSGVGAAPDAGKRDEDGNLLVPDADTVYNCNTGQKYRSETDSPLKFYIDAKGYLRTFFNVGGYYYASYVYELKDDQYVRTEALQRALGSFINKLTDRSPSALISAFAYNDEDAVLPLLEETSGSEAAIDLMKEYPLDGGTYTQRGLQSFYESKYRRGKDDETVGDKFVIIFTDGNDAKYDGGEITVENNDSKKYAEKLKADGYTVYTVMLASGSLDKTNTDTKANYDKARKFLCSLAGKEGVTVSANDEDEGIGKEYDEKGNLIAKRYFYAPASVDELAKSFVVEILKNIAPPLDTYTMKDYIDPRFDLVTEETVQDAEGKPVTEEYIWHLKANGEVEKVLKSDGKTVVATYNVNVKDENADKDVKIHLSGDTIPAARYPVLHYDGTVDEGGNDMYYLEWTGQTIPTSAVGTTSLEIWHAEVEVRAKDDFIGGNDILVGGNKAKMNWVYRPSDTDRSSGTGDDGQEDGEIDLEKGDYPSKGFPRVTANVQLLPIWTNNLYNVIYMGEAVSPMQILTEIKDNYVTESYYLDYLKRYAYQRYDRLTALDGDTEEEKSKMDRPLLDLLYEWLELDNEKVKEKAFSVPYMYLPEIKWDEESGKVELDDNGKATTIYNNTGDPETNQLDVVGVLTYRWEQLEPDFTDLLEPIEDSVKHDTDRVRYSLTVEYTPLRTGDEPGTFGYGDAVTPTPSGDEADTAFTVVEAIGGSGVTAVARSEDGKAFAPYLPINTREKAEVTSTTRLDREKYINGNTGETDHRGEYRLIEDDVYDWNKIAKPAVGAQELNDVFVLEDGTHAYGDASFMNDYGTEGEHDYRTLTAFSEYTLDAVGGGIALELEMLVGELEELLETLGKNSLQDYEFTLQAKRSFTDTEFIEDLKKNKYDGSTDALTWEDYGDTFTIKFKFNYTPDQLKTLIETIKSNPKAYSGGYIKLYASITEIKAKFGNEKDGFKDVDLTDLGLPIGTYEFELDDVNTALKDVLGDALNFSSFRKSDSELKDDYFNDNVLNGLYAGGERQERDADGHIVYYDSEGNPLKRGRDEHNNIVYRDADGNIVLTREYDADKNIIYRNADGEIVKAPEPHYYQGAEITDGNIDNYGAKAKTGSRNEKVTFYVGTGEDNKRSSVGENLLDTERYTYQRLGMLTLSTGNTLLTIHEDGAESSDESFLYEIEGMTLGNVHVKLTVSVKGNKATTIELPPGDYTVTELDKWSWKYENKDTYDTLHPDGEGRYSRPGGDWNVTTSTYREAYTELRYRTGNVDVDPGAVDDHHEITFAHQRNNKHWLGGESHEDNRFE